MEKMEVKNIYYGNTDETFDCEINHPSFGWIPFTASANDVEQHGRDIYTDIKNGKYGEPQNRVIEVTADKVI